MWSPEYVLPRIGNFQCSFIYMAPNRPTREEAMREDEVLALMSFFKDKHDSFMRECEEVNM